jgi:hypothetical protein
MLVSPPHTIGAEQYYPLWGKEPVSIPVVTLSRREKEHRLTPG